MRTLLATLVSTACLLTACAPEQPAIAQRLFAVRDGELAVFDVESGAQLNTTVAGLEGATGMQALHDGTLLVNLTPTNEVAVIDGAALKELKRIPSSSAGATHPVHSFISPELSGRQYWLTMNDGTGSTRATNSALFVDIAADSKTYLEPVAELPLGVGHHKAAFSKTKPRVVISNIADCSDVLSIYDYSDIANIKTLRTLSAAEAGFDGSSRPKTCDQTRQLGVSPSPHGCATASENGRVYCNLTGAGQLAAIDVDADTPTIEIIDMGGSGGGAVEAIPGGPYLLTVQSKPREGAGGAVGEVGRMLIIDSRTDAIVATLPLGYTGPSSTAVLTGSDEAAVGPGHVHVSGDGRHAFVTVNGGFGDASSRSRQQLVVDLSSPEAPKQLPSIATGAGTGHRGVAMSGDHQLLFVADASDGSVTQIHCAQMKATRTLAVGGAVEAMATWGSKAGPSCQHGPVAQLSSHDHSHHH